MKIIKKWNEWVDDYPSYSIWIFIAIISISIFGIRYTSRIFNLVWVGLIIYSLYKMMMIVMGVAPRVY